MRGIPAPRRPDVPRLLLIAALLSLAGAAPPRMGPPGVLPGEFAAVRSLAFSADGQRLAMGQRQATVRLWDVVDGRQRAILEGPVKPGSTGTVRPMFFSPDGKTLATTESLDAGTARLWDLPPP